MKLIIYNHYNNDSNGHFDQFPFNLIYFVVIMVFTIMKVILLNEMDAFPSKKEEKIYIQLIVHGLEVWTLE